MKVTRGCVFPISPAKTKLDSGHGLGFPSLTLSSSSLNALATGGGGASEGDGAKRRATLAPVFSITNGLFNEDDGMGEQPTFGIAICATVGRATAETVALLGGAAFLAVGRTLEVQTASNSGVLDGEVTCARTLHSIPKKLYRQNDI